MATMNVAILGAGNIASSMAKTLQQMDDSICAYAVASRSFEKAEIFADQYHVKKAYGSYEELVEDPEVDLIYVATPHAMHYENAKLCIEHGKNVLLEKAFTVNAKQAKELIHLAEEKKVFLTEAIWTRYMPFKEMALELLKTGIIGETKTLKAEFLLPNFVIKRMQSPELAGGALLDLGVYTLTFASMFFGDDIVSMESECKKYKTGVDAAEDIILHYKNGKTANLKASMTHIPKCEAVIYGTNGSLKFEEFNNPSTIKWYDANKKLKHIYYVPDKITGYEYEVLACQRALENKELSCPEMPHEETIKIMEWMDALRKKWGVIYPFETEADLE